MAERKKTKNTAATAANPSAGNAPADAVLQALAILRANDPAMAERLELAIAEQKNEQEIEAALKTEAEKQKEEQHFWIEINRLPEDTDSHVFVGAAGVSYQIEKGARVPVPRSVVEILNHAEVIGYIPVVDFTTNTKALKQVKYKRFPFSVFGAASPESVKRWKEEQAERARLIESRGRAIPAAEQDDGLDLDNQPTVEFPQ